MGTKLGLSKKNADSFRREYVEEDIWGRDANGGWRKPHDKFGNKWIHTARNITRISGSASVRQTQHVRTMHEGHEKCLRNLVGKKKNVFSCYFSFYICTRSVDNNKCSCFSPHIQTHTAVSSGLPADIVSVSLWYKTCWATFPDIRNLCAGSKRREIFSLPTRFARDWHANSQLIKCGISVTPSSLTVHLIIQSIVNKI